MEKAIQKAIEGGYLGAKKLIDFDGAWSSKFIYETPEGYTTTREVSDALLDRDFWQALGKAMGWGVADGWGGKYAHASEPMPHWKHVWHEFIDHLAEGGTADDFFTNLLK